METRKRTYVIKMGQGHERTTTYDVPWFENLSDCQNYLCDHEIVRICQAEIERRARERARYELLHASADINGPVVVSR